jgi:signal transduction histidine kinase
MPRCRWARRLAMLAVVAHHLRTPINEELEAAQ